MGVFVSFWVFLLCFFNIQIQFGQVGIIFVDAFSFLISTSKNGRPASRNFVPRCPRGGREVAVSSWTAGQQPFSFPSPHVVPNAVVDDFRTQNSPFAAWRRQYLVTLREQADGRGTGLSDVENLVQHGRDWATQDRECKHS